MATERSHPRTIGWLGTSALAMGGSNQSLFLLSALFIGQGNIPGQGTAAVPLLLLGLLLSWMALPGWTELILMWPNRVGGIAATCGEAFRPYAPVLGNLVGVSYWWGWVPTCGLTALLSASAITQWFLPGVSVPLLACIIVATFTAINLSGVNWASRLAVGIAAVSASLAFLSVLIPVLSGSVDWRQAASFELTTPFPGAFGAITSAMAGLYIIGFAAPAFEAAACHVGETIDPAKNVPRAMFASAGMATLYFLAIPVVWLGAIGPKEIAGDLAVSLGPVFAPLFGAFGKSAAIFFMMFNMFHGTLAPLTGVARTLSQLSEDGLLPEVFAKRNSRDCPWVAIVITAGSAIVFLLIGDPLWLIAAANFTYLIGIALPSVAVWLLRKDQPHMERPYRAPKGTITLGLIAAIVWGISTIIGFQQFGLPTVILALGLAYSGSILYAYRKWSDRRKSGMADAWHSLHVKLTGAMLLVLILDGAGYYLAVSSVTAENIQLVTLLEDIFVAVAVLTISVGLVLPGMIAHSAVEVARAAEHLATGTLADFSRAMGALAKGDLDGANARLDIVPVTASSRDELGAMARSFNTLQEEVARAAVGLTGAREGLRAARTQLAAKERLEHELEIARTIQTSILPKNIQIEGFDVAAWMVPADEVGGDYYDIFRAEGKDWVFIGDVSGHGVSAGLVMMMAQTAVRTAVLQANTSAPSNILSTVNTSLWGNIQNIGKNQYMTMTALRIEGRKISYAGMHQDILVYRAATQEIERIETHGIWLGLLERAADAMEDQSFQVSEGDIILLFTDGLTELKIGAQLLGTDGLIGWFQSAAKTSSKEIAGELLNKLKSHTPKDDASVVVLRCIRREG